MFVRQAACARGNGAGYGGGIARHSRCRSDRGRRAGHGSRRGRSGHGCSGRRAGAQGADVFAGFADRADGLQAGNVVALTEEDGQQQAVHLGFFVERRLVRLVGEQQVANRHPLAHALVPLSYHAAFHRLPLPRHDHRRRHRPTSFALQSRHPGTGRNPEKSTNRTPAMTGVTNTPVFPR